MIYLTQSDTLFYYLNSRKIIFVLIPCNSYTYYNIKNYLKRKYIIYFIGINKYYNKCIVLYFYSDT